MTFARLLGLLVAAPAALALEAACPPDVRLAGEVPDLLLAAAAYLAARPGGSIVAAALLGALRDAASGGVAGRFTLGFIVGALLVRAAFGRVRERGLGLAISASFVGALAAHVLAAAVSAALHRARFSLEDALAVAALTGAFTPTIAVPLAALETLAGDRDPKPELARR